MVWFQCEDCGENLKKPKLLNHFRICSANKLSCIDCGEMFGQQSVQSHTQCITEAEKYGPKDQGKAWNKTTPKAKNESRKNSDVDINVGLSSRPPWFCSLCKTSATSKQTLLLHAEGKKHRSKARAFHASKQPKVMDGSTPNTKDVASGLEKMELVAKKDEATPELNNMETEKGTLSSKKKRKLDASDDGSAEVNGEVIQAKGGKEPDSLVKKIRYVDASEEVKKDVNGNTKEPKNKIKWKKLIASVLTSNGDGSMKIRKLQKIVLKSVQEDGVSEDEDQVREKVRDKINSSSRFRIEKKVVSLVTKS